MDGLQIQYEENTSLQIGLHDTSEQQSFHSLTVDDFKRLCRTCMSQIPNHRSIYDVVYESYSVNYLLMKYGGVEIEEPDYLPQQICNNCLSELLHFQTFQEKCQTTERILKRIKSEYTQGERALEEPDGEEQLEFIKTEEIKIITEIDEDDDDDDNVEYINLQEYEDESKSEESDCESKKKDIKQPGRKKRTRAGSGGIIKCNECDTNFETRELLKAHQKEAKHYNVKKMKPCETCGKLFSSSKMKQHMRAHTKEKPYVCKICAQGFSMRGNLKRHMMTHTGERPHVCEICGKGFIQATTLMNHRRTHMNIEQAKSESPNYFCSVCGRAFKRLARYNAHLKKHLSDNVDEEDKKPKREEDEVREYICDICKRAYKTRHLLKAHQLTHGEKTFLCADCGKGFVTKAALLSHLKVHTGEKPHTCTICKKSFAHVGSFEAHMLIHTGQKPYNCTVCSKNFTQLSHLKYHLRTHSGERPYICSYCGKTFALKGNLTVHVRIHTGETPYTCNVCGKGFYDSSSMKKHQRGHFPMLHDPPPVQIQQSIILNQDVMQEQKLM